MGYRTEHPQFNDTGEIAQLLALGWTDHSWHNDTCPRLHSADETLALWIEYADLAMRDSGEDTPRFCVIHAGGYAEDAYLFTSEDWTETLGFLALYAEETARLPEWMRAAHAAGKLWHLDDSPASIDPPFTRAEVGALYVRRDECFAATECNPHAYCIFLTNRPASWLALDDAMRALYGEGLNPEQRECLDDPARRDECLGMLDDMQARMGIPAAVVDAVRAELDGPWQ